MCLSDVIAVSGETEELLFRNIAAVSQKGEKLIFSDILGRINVVIGWRG